LDKQVENKKAVSFENLKKLNAILGGNELSQIVANIAKSRAALDVFCKNLKNHENSLKKQTVVNVEPKKESVEEKVAVRSEAPSQAAPRPSSNTDKLNRNDNKTSEIKFSKVPKGC